MTATDQPYRATTRTEAFSNGVFAIAMTLPALNIKVPPSGEIAGGRLLGALLAKYLRHPEGGLAIFYALPDPLRRFPRGQN